MSVLATADLPAASAERDVRDPLLRLAQLFDGNDCDLHPAGDTEVRTAAGRINGAFMGVRRQIMELPIRGGRVAQ